MEFSRGSMQGRATNGSSFSKSTGCSPALASPATARGLASIITSISRGLINHSTREYPELGTTNPGKDFSHLLFPLPKGREKTFYGPSPKLVPRLPLVLAQFSN